MVKNEMEASYEIYILFYQFLNKLHDQRQVRKGMFYFIVIYMYRYSYRQNKYFIKVSPLDLYFINIQNKTHI